MSTASTPQGHTTGTRSSSWRGSTSTTMKPQVGTNCIYRTPPGANKVKYILDDLDLLTFKSASS